VVLRLEIGGVEKILVLHSNLLKVVRTRGGRESSVLRYGRAAVPTRRLLAVEVSSGLICPGAEPLNSFAEAAKGGVGGSPSFARDADLGVRSGVLADQKGNWARLVVHQAKT